MCFRLFVSHSNPGLARQVAYAVEAIPHTAIRVLVDSGEIGTGDDWRERICFMLGTCDAAVVLLDLSALESKWVLAEATYLSVRAGYTAPGERPFRLLPASLLASDSFSNLRAELERRHRKEGHSSWDVVALADIQYLEATDAALIAQSVVKTLSDTGGLEPEFTPMERLAQSLQGVLKRAEDSCLLQVLADSLGLDAPSRAQPLAARAALALVRELIRGGRMQWVRNQLDALGYGLEPGDIRRVIKTLTPLLFNAGAAAQLRRGSVPSRSRATWIRTGQPKLTIEAFLRLAHLPGKPGPVLRMVCLEGTAEATHAALLKAYRDGSPEAQERHVDEIEQRLQGLSAYVITSPLDAHVLTQLEQTYPKLRFVSWYTDEEPALPPGGMTLVPPNDLVRETQIWIDVDNAYAGLTGL